MGLWIPWLFPLYGLHLDKDFIDSGSDTHFRALAIYPRSLYGSHKIEISMKEIIRFLVYPI